MSSAPAKVETNQATVAMVNHYKPVIEKLLIGTTTNAETYVAQLGNCFRATPELWNCEPATVLGAALRCAQLDMPPNDGTNRAFIIPYGKVATFQLGYGGVLELARRAVPGLQFEGSPVYPNDIFDVDKGRVPPLRHRSYLTRRLAKRERGGDAYAWYVLATYPDGRQFVHFLDREGVEYHRSFSKQPNGQMWTKSYDAAALKSVVLDMKRWLPPSPQIAVAFAADGAVHDVREMDRAGAIVAAPYEELSAGSDADAPDPAEPDGVAS